MNNAIINRGTIIQNGFDSGRLSPLCVVIHKFPNAGEFQGKVYQDDKPVGSFRLSVNKSSGNKQVNIDLATLTPGEPRQPGVQSTERFDLQPGGNAVFYVSSGRGGNAVTVNQIGLPNFVVFDSRSLDKGDVFLVTLLRPGQYKMTNTVSKIESQVKVNYPAAASAPMKSLALQTTTVGAKQFGATMLEMQAIQGLAVQCNTPTRLTMQITQTFDKPPVVSGAGEAKTMEAGAPRPGKVTWRKPGTGH